MKEIEDAIVAAGKELQSRYAWRLDGDESKPVTDTVFAQVVQKHIMLAIDPEVLERRRAARIAVLRAEITELLLEDGNGNEG